MSDKPFWYPVLCDEIYYKRLREDYPENAHWSDDELWDYYNEGNKYSILWDHIGEAYEPLADAFLKQQSQIDQLSTWTPGLPPAPGTYAVRTIGAKMLAVCMEIAQPEGDWSTLEWVKLPE